MTRFIAATYHHNLKVAEFIADDGRHLLRTGGTLPWRINNSGDLSSPVNSRGEPNPKRTRDYIGFASVPNKARTSTYHFFIFPDYETGRAQLEASLKRKYADHCIPELVEKYAPSHDNDTKSYAEKLLRSTDIDEDKKIGDLSADELKSLVDAIEKLEGYHNEAHTRREIWVPVSTIMATDGARPLAEAEIVLRVNGKDTALKSNAVGQFPPIPHSREPIKVLQRTADDKLKELGAIEGDKGQSYSLINQFQRFMGMSGPDSPPPDANGQQKPFVYQVQPGDTLGAIAKRFRISVDKLRTDNRRRNDKLFAGELLSIHAAAPAELVPAKAAPRTVPAKQNAVSAKRPAPESMPPSAEKTQPARSDEGEGKPLALMPPDQRRAPWMVYAIAEAKRLKGMQEAEIEAGGTNYHAAIKDGVKSMVGSNNAWCAAFVNWCLSQAGYPIDTKSIWAARARGIRSHDLRDDKGNLIQNPLFAQIDAPIFGCIAMEAYIKSGLGHHVGFVYAREDDNHLVVLGGNQSDRIMFAKYAAASKKNKLEYFVPVSYKEQAARDLREPLGTGKAKEFNKEFGISLEKAVEGQTR